METADFVQLALLVNDGEIRGKTALQKKIYFLGLLTDCAEELGYRPHFYGPYSAEVADAITYLKAIHVLEEDVEPCGIVDESGFEVKRHDFRLNDAGHKLAERRASDNPQLWKKVKSAAKILREAGDLDYVLLSIAAKTYYMLGKKRGSATAQQLADLAPRFGWKVEPQQVNQAAKYLRKIGLVEPSDS